MSVAPLESKLFEVHEVLAVGGVFVLISLGFDLYDLPAVQSAPLA